MEISYLLGAQPVCLYKKLYLQTADMLLAQAYSALNEAEKAVERGNNSYYEILDILASLESKR